MPVTFNEERKIGTSVSKSSVALNEDWPRLLVTFFDSPDWLWK